MNNNKSQIFFGVILAIVFILAVFVLSPFLITLSLAIVASIILYPVYKKITNFFWGNKTIGSFLTIVLLVILILIPASLLSMQILQEAQGIYGSLHLNEGSIAVNRINNYVNNIFVDFSPSLDFHIGKYISDFTSWTISNLGNLFSKTFDIFVKLMVVIVALFFLLKDGDKFEKIFKELSPLSSSVHEYLSKSIKISVNSIILGSIITAIIQGILAGIAFSFFGIPNATFWGTVGVMAAFVPGIGMWSLFIPMIIYSALTGSLYQWLGLLIWVTVVHNSVDTFLRPALMHKSVNIHPLFILFSILGGISFIGPSGFILGPLILSLLFAMIRVYKNEKINSEN